MLFSKNFRGCLDTISIPNPIKTGIKARMTAIMESPGYLRTQEEAEMQALKEVIVMTFENVSAMKLALKSPPTVPEAVPATETPPEPRTLNASPVPKAAPPADGLYSQSPAALLRDKGVSQAELDKRTQTAAQDCVEVLALASCAVDAVTPTRAISNVVSASAHRIEKSSAPDARVTVMRNPGDAGLIDAVTVTV